jgi:hypothetical protein
MTFGSVRHSRRVQASADRVWALVGDPARLHHWWPGIVGCTVNGTERVIELASGLTLPEEILVHDHVQRRFQYRITAPFFTFHRGTIDVIDLDDDTCVVTYAVDADPRTMALVIAGAGAAGLDEVARLVETDLAEEAP